MPLDPSLGLAQKYLALTLAVERALSEEAWTEVDGLLAERDRILTKLETKPISEAARSVLAESREHEHRVMAQLATFKATLAAEMGTLQQGTRAIKAFRQQQG